MKVYVAGHTGLVGSNTIRELRRAGHEVWHPPHRIDLRVQSLARIVLEDAIENGCTAVVLAAAKVGGIGANASQPVDFLYDNLAISMNVIRASYDLGVKRLVNLGSSCIYPRDAPQPMREEALLTGPLESTNRPYALAKIAALELVRAYRRQHHVSFVSLMPTNLYGPGDRYDEERSHVIPALIMKIERARKTGIPPVLWGSGKPLREFLHVADLARAIVMAVEDRFGFDRDLLNVGSDEEIAISDLADLVADTVGYRGEIQWDVSKPDGTPRKRLDSSRMRACGWSPQVDLRRGLIECVDDYRRRFGT